MGKPIFRPNSKMLVPIFNPQIKTRYLVNLPSELNIEPFQISSIILPSMYNKELFLGLINVLEHSDCEMEIIWGVENPIKKLIELYHINSSYDIRVELLDPLGMVTSEMLINGFLKSIKFDELKYGNDDLFKTKISFGVNSFTMR